MINSTSNPVVKSSLALTGSITMTAARLPLMKDGQRWKSQTNKNSHGGKESLPRQSMNTTPQEN